LKKVSIGLIGFGYWGPNLARAVFKQESALLSAIVETDIHRLCKARSEFPDVESFDNLNEAISSKKFEAAIIATPALTHEDISEKLLTSEIHLLVEKPMIINPAIGTKLAKIAVSLDLTYMPGHTFLFNESIVWAKNYIDSGKLGKVLNIYSQRLNFGQLRRDVNVIWNLAPHDVSIFDYLLNSRVKNVSATASSVLNPRLFDVAFLSFEYESGIMAHSHVSWLDPSKTRKITIIGSKGMLVIDDTKQNRKIELHEKFAKKTSHDAPSFEEYPFQIHSGTVHYPIIKEKEPLYLEVRDFIESILFSKPPRANFEDGIRVSKVLCAVENSISFGGSKIEVDYLND
jgi:predicted dehydrogenase